MNSCYLRRRLTANPVQPIPSRPSVAGSGTDTVLPQVLCLREEEAQEALVLLALAFAVVLMLLPVKLIGGVCRGA